MLNRIILRRIRRVVSDTEFYPQLISEPLKLFFEQVIAGIIAAPTITKNQHRASQRIELSAMIKPPPPQRIAGELTGVMTGTYGDVSEVVVQVVNPVGDSFALSERRKIMIIDLHCLLSVKRARTIQRPDHFFFLVSILITGFPAA